MDSFVSIKTKNYKEHKTLVYICSNHKFLNSNVFKLSDKNEEFDINLYDITYVLQNIVPEYDFHRMLDFIDEILKYSFDVMVRDYKGNMIICCNMD